jgi:hypothetical protein
MVSLGLETTLVISDPYNIRRLYMVFEKVFQGSGMELWLTSTDQKRKVPDYWWLSPHLFM